MPRVRCAAVALRGAGRDLHEAEPASAPAYGLRVPGALEAGQGRQEARPEGRPLLRLGLDVVRAPGADVAGDLGQQRGPLGLERGQRRLGPFVGVRAGVVPGHYGERLGDGFDLGLRGTGTEERERQERNHRAERYGSDTGYLVFVLHGRKTKRVRMGA